MTRRVAGWLVTDYGGEWEDSWELPVRVFTDLDKAEQCAAKRHVRNRRLDDAWDYCDSRVTEIEVVINY